MAKGEIANTALDGAFGAVLASGVGRYIRSGRRTGRRQGGTNRRPNGRLSTLLRRPSGPLYAVDGNFCRYSLLRSLLFCCRATAWSGRVREFGDIVLVTG